MQQNTLGKGEQVRIQKAVGSRVYKLEKNNAIRSKLFQQLNHELKERFGVSSYKFIRQTDMLKAIKYIENWIPRRVS